MIKRKKLFIFYILLFLISFNFIRPRLIIHGAENNLAEVSVVMDIYDKEYDGDVSIWYVNKIRNSTRNYVLLNKEIIKINYPLLYDKKGSKNFIIMYYMEKNANNSKNLHRFFINADLLYFWTLEFFLDDSGEIINSYLKKYPWSKKEEYNIKSVLCGCLNGAEEFSISEKMEPVTKQW
ncbi:MAG: hypothetical protein ACI4PR_05630 [Acutalibacteraceae bacterium]